MLVASVITRSLLSSGGSVSSRTVARLTFRAGEYACRPIGIPHGPYRTEAGCTMLEIRY